MLLLASTLHLPLGIRRRIGEANGPTLNCLLYNKNTMGGHKPLKGYLRFSVRMSGLALNVNNARSVRYFTYLSQ